ncbi:MAG: Na+/H+ antiporter subunit E, partial [Brevundimonas sp.]
MRRILPYPVLSLGLFVASILLSASVAPPSLVLALLLALLAPIIMLALGVDRVRLKAPKAMAR